MLTPAKGNRLLLGLVVQPFVAAALAYLLFPMVVYVGRMIDAGGGRLVDPLESAFGFSIMAGVIASVVAGIAYPVIMWILERGPLTRAQTMIAGIVFGNAPFALTIALLAAQHLSRSVVPTPENLTYGWIGLIRIVTLGSLVGLVCASVFWWVAGRHLMREENSTILP